MKNSFLQVPIGPVLFGILIGGSVLAVTLRFPQITSAPLGTNLTLSAFSGFIGWGFIGNQWFRNILRYVFGAIAGICMLGLSVYVSMLGWKLFELAGMWGPFAFALHCFCAFVGWGVGLIAGGIVVYLSWVVIDHVEQATLDTVARVVLPKDLGRRVMFWRRLIEATLYRESIVPAPGAYQLENESLISSGLGWFGRQILIYRARKAQKVVRYLVQFPVWSLLILLKNRNYKHTGSGAPPPPALPAEARTATRNEKPDEGELV